MTIEKRIDPSRKTHHSSAERTTTRTAPSELGSDSNLYLRRGLRLWRNSWRFTINVSSRTCHLSRSVFVLKCDASTTSRVSHVQTLFIIQALRNDGIKYTAFCITGYGSKNAPARPPIRQSYKPWGGEKESSARPINVSITESRVSLVLRSRGY